MSTGPGAVLPFDPPPYRENNELAEPETVLGNRSRVFPDDEKISPNIERRRQRWRIGVSALAITVAHAASAQNLVTNGSFEGTNGLAGWSIGGTAPDGALPVAIQYNQSSSYPTGAQGEAVPTDNAPSASPDSAGLNGVYFVSDTAKNLSVYQNVYLTPGSYQIGFDTYDTFNGAVQPNDANLAADIAGVELANYKLSSVEPGIWTTHAGTALITTAGYYPVAFIFNPTAFPAKDVVIDRAYVIGGASGGMPVAPIVRLYWDGDAPGNVNNNSVDGGTGTWTAASPNFTDQAGATNGAYFPQPGSVIFEEAPGVVTADNSAGQISVTGMQFAVNGYDVIGGPITLTGPNATIQVGDGTAAGAGYTATVASTLTGSSGLIKTDLGTLVLTGQNSYTGGTMIAAGAISINNASALGTGLLALNEGTALAFSGAGFTLPNNIVFAQAGDPTIDTGNGAVTLSGVISGLGALDKVGPGTLTLTNTETYTGGTEIHAGALEIGNAATPDAQLAAGLVTVDPGATLGGYGTIGGSIMNNGTLDNNNNFAPLGLTVNGIYRQGSHGNLIIGVTPNTASLLKVGGAATLAGSVTFAYAAGTYHPADLKFLNAGGGVTGTFSTVAASTAPPTGLNIGIAYKPNEADLVLAAPVMFVAPNDSEIFSAQNFTFAESNEDAITTLLGRTRPDGDGSTFYNLTSEGGPEVRAWTDGIGNFINTNSREVAPGLHTTSGGAETGADVALTGQTRLGVALGYGRNTFTDSEGGSASQDVFRLSLYGSKNAGPIGLSAVLSYAHAWDNTDRASGLGPARATWGNDAFTGALQASAPFSYGVFVVTPSVGLTVSVLTSARFVETGKPGFAVTGAASGVTSASPFALLGLSHTLTTESGATITPDAEIGYRDDGASQGGHVTLTAADGTSFANNQFEVNRNGALLGASMTLHRNQLTAFAKYTAMVSGDWTDQRVEAGLRYAF